MAQRGITHPDSALIMFGNWHTSADELVASGEVVNLEMHCEHREGRPFVEEIKRARDGAGFTLAEVSRRWRRTTRDASGSWGNEEELESLRRSVRRGHPLAGPEPQKEIASRLGVKSEYRRKGRPRRVSRNQVAAPG
jgi:hypothetical protein